MWRSIPFKQATWPTATCEMGHGRGTLRREYPQITQITQIRSSVGSRYRAQKSDLQLEARE